MKISTSNYLVKYYENNFKNFSFILVKEQKDKLQKLMPEITYM
jgi:hypothetical protein